MNPASEYIFCSHTDKNDEVIVYIQNAKAYEMGYSDEVPDKMVEVLGSIVDDGGFVVMDQHLPILCHETESEIVVVRYLKDQGLIYSPDLELEIEQKNQK